MRADLEGGMALADGRYHLVRELIDAHETALDAVSRRIDDLERFTRERLEAQAHHLGEIARLTEANRQLALTNKENARETERIAKEAEERVRRAKEQLAGVTRIVTRPGCGDRGYWDVEAQACAYK